MAIISDRPKLVSADISADMSAEMSVSVSVSVVPAETDITMHYLTRGFDNFCLIFHSINGKVSELLYFQN